MSEEKLEFPEINRIYSANMPINKEYVNRASYYLAYPSFYQSYAYFWLRPCLEWFDGRVQGIHNESNGIISTKLASVICSKVSEQIFGGGLLFNKKGIENQKDEEEKALKFISGEFKDQIDLDNKILQAFIMSSAGGTAYIKENVEISKKYIKENDTIVEKQVRDMWIDVWRADSCYADFDYKGQITRATFLNCRLTQTNPQKKDRNFYLIEERFYATEKDNKEYKERFKKKIESLQLPSDLQVGRPYIRIIVKELYGNINNEDMSTQLSDRAYNWEEIPREIQDKIKAQFGIVDINVPKLLPLLNLGVICFKWTPFIKNLPQLPFGESLIANIQSDLYEYDVMNSCMNTDMYLGRGRVLMPKALQNPNARNQNYNQGFDSFLFTKYDSSSVDDQKPQAIQYELRSQDWANLRNNILETIATKIGIASSTLASFLNDGSNRTAREISSEESATSLFVENKRKLFTKPINDLIDDILLFYGFKPSIVVKFSKSGQTNTTLLIDNTTSVYGAGLMSKYLAIKTLNPDMSADELDEEIRRLEKEDKEKQMQSDMFGFNDINGDFGNGQNENNIGERKESELANDSDRGMPIGHQESNQTSIVEPNNIVASEE